MTRNLEELAKTMKAFDSLPDCTLLTNEEVAMLLDVEGGTLANWACTKRYHFPHVKIGSNRMYSAGVVRKVMREGLIKAEEVA